MEDIGERVAALLVELGLAQAGEPVKVTPLTGGVSSDIALAEAGGERYCVKFALAQLKVSAIWTAPVGRNAADYDWLDYVGGFAPDLVPRLYGRSHALGGFAMAYLDPAKNPNWKAELLAGRVDTGFAAQVGAALGDVHARAASDPTIAARFDHREDFYQLRLDPYLVFAASHHPDLAERLGAIVAGLQASSISLVHGDVSPKNILMGARGPVLLDAECAVIGDPAFDVAFCLNHLVIKTMAAKADPDALADAALGLWTSYLSKVDWEAQEALAARVTGILPALMLARVDGKSPVEYLSEPQRDQLRDLARRLIETAPGSVPAIIEAALAAGRSQA